MKNLRVTVNGKAYDVQVEEIGASVSAAPAPAAAPAPVSAPAPAAPAAPAAAPAAGGETISAPMPGKILSVKVKAGDSVSKGDVLVVFEAMKMENEIKAPRNCTIVSVSVSKDDTVETGSPVVSIQ